MLFVFSVGFPPFDDATEVNLTLHMLQHVLIVFAGVMVAYPIFGRRLIAKGIKTPVSIASLVGSSLLILFWHLPVPWDMAVLNPGVHVLEHASFFLVGLLSGSWLLLLSDSGKIGALFAAFFGHMGYALALISPWGIQVYSLYSLGDQAILGWTLLLTGPVLLVGVAYVIARNPGWLEGVGGTVSTGSRRRTFVDNLRVPGFLAPAVALTLVVVFVGYFGATAYALAVSGPTHSGGTVIISETPVSWQFSPQDVTVRLGVNSTVTWVSHSISYDTVTDKGVFDSGPIPPGGTFTFTFSSPGVYQYSCIFHPWMKGTVTVVG